MRVWLTGFMAVALAASAWAQDVPKPEKEAPKAPGAPGEDEEDLTPEKALALLKDAQGLMVKSEDLLHGSSQGRALETQKDILDKLKDLLKDEKDAGAAQKQVLEKIQKLMQKSEGSQKDAIEKMVEIIKKAKS